jgi:hypothetical protein
MLNIFLETYLVLSFELSTELVDISRISIESRTYSRRVLARKTILDTNIELEASLK